MVACLSTGFLWGTNMPLGWPQRRVCHGQIFSRREDKGSSLSLANSNFNGTCIPGIPLSSLFVQIIGIDEFTIILESLGWILLKTQSVKEMNWNLAKSYYEDYIFEIHDYFVEATRLNAFFFFFGETSKWVEKFGAGSCKPCCFSMTLSTFLNDSNFKFVKLLSQDSNQQNKHKTTTFNNFSYFVAYLFHFSLFKKP